MIPAADSSADWYKQLTESSFLDYEIQKYLLLRWQLVARLHVWLLLPWVSPSGEKNGFLTSICLVYWFTSWDLNPWWVNASIKIVRINRSQEGAWSDKLNTLLSLLLSQFSRNTCNASGGLQTSDFQWNSTGVSPEIFKMQFQTKDWQGNSSVNISRFVRRVECMKVCF